MRSIALLSVFSWSCFWVFGGLAVLSPHGSPWTLPEAGIAALGLVVGLVCFFKLRGSAWSDLLKARR